MIIYNRAWAAAVLFAYILTAALSLALCERLFASNSCFDAVTEPLNSSFAVGFLPHTQGKSFEHVHGSTSEAKVFLVIRSSRL